MKITAKKPTTSKYDQWAGKGTNFTNTSEYAGLQARQKELQNQMGSIQGRGIGQNLQRNQLQKQLNSLNSQLTNAAQGRNADGSYIRPEFASMIDKNTGMLSPEYTLQYQNVDLNTQGLDKFRGEALRDASQNSAWAQMMIDKENLNRQANLDSLMQEQRTGLMGQYDNLASQGGVTGAARERMARGGIKDLLTARQQARRDSQGNVMNVRTQDEQNRVNMLGQLPGMELAKSGFDMQNQENTLRAREYNQRNALTEINRLRDDSLNAWKTNMETWGANKTANAQAKAAKGGKK